MNWLSKTGWPRLLTLGAMSWFILWACAPMMSTPPATPMRGPNRSELGVSAHGGGALHAHQSIEDLERGGGLDRHALIGGGTLWFRRARGKNYQHQSGMFLHTAAYQQLSPCDEYCTDIAWGIGGFYRMSLTQSETFTSSIQVTGGYPFITLGAPMAWKVQDDLWLTTQPRLGVGFVSLVHLPVGASIPVGEHGRLDAEIGLHVEAEALGRVGAPIAQMRNNIYDGFDHYQYTPYIGVGYSMLLGTKQ